MIARQLASRRSRAISLLESLLPPEQSAAVVEGLTEGLTHLRDCMFHRIHEDVETSYGMDSLVAPLPADRGVAAKWEIEAYQVAEALALSDVEPLPTSMLTLAEVLGELRFGDAQENERLRQRLTHYAEVDHQADRSRVFGDLLGRVFPESRRAPLVLFRLFPLAVQMEVALAFEQVGLAQRLRSKQLAILPALRDCGSCHGVALRSASDPCTECGSPLWTYRWLNQ